MSSPPEQDDVARRQSVREFVEPEVEVLLRVARAMSASDADAEDLVQETLLRAYRGLHRFDGRHPRAWLLTILRNTNVNLHRRRRPILIDDDEWLRASRPAFGRTQSPSAEDCAVDLELDAELDAAVSSLSREFRSALLLVDVHDLSYAEAAAVLGVPVGTVMSRLSRARDRVRRHLGPSILSRGRSS
jgi:RNA polymerase sigma-70 factor (ECF subfamily)